MNSIGLTFQPDGGAFKIIVPFRWRGEIGERFAVSAPDGDFTAAVVSTENIEIRTDGIFANGAEIDADAISAECSLAKDKIFAFAKTKNVEGSIVKFERV